MRTRVAAAGRVAMLASLLASLVILFPGEPVRTCFTFAFAGDVMLGRGVAQSLDGEWSEAFAAVRPWLDGADLAFANLESPLTELPHTGGGPDLRAVPEAAMALRMGGFDAVSLANNHCQDAGEAGLRDTVAALCGAGIVPVAGQKPGVALPPGCAQDGGSRFRLLAFDDSVEPLDLRTATALVEDAAREVQIVIVSVHWGIEYQTSPTLRQKSVAAALATAGATVTVGHGPHVLQRVEWVGDALVAYSLGNFEFDQAYPVDCSWGAVLQVTVCDGRISSVQATPTVVERGRVRPAGRDVRRTSESIPAMEPLSRVP